MDTAEQFETYRPQLFAIAYRMTGSAMEAEDLVQESYLRYRSVEPTEIRSLKAFLTTVVTRLCLNHLQLARVQREQYTGPWLPEPLTTGSAQILSPPDQLARYESISLAFLTLLETLTPVERAVFLLREVFDYDYAEIAAIVEKSEPSCRQLFRRAKQHLAERRPRFRSTPTQQHQLLEQFMHAVSAGEFDGLTKLLAEDVTMWADSGGKVRGAATRPLYGSQAVAQFVLASPRFLQPDYTVEIVGVNGAPAAILRVAGKPFLLIIIEVDGEFIHEIRLIANPDKLQRL